MGRQQEDPKSALLNKDISAMGHSSAIFLLFGVTAYVQGLCTFKEGAEDSVSVDYWTDELGNTAVDRVTVKMRKGRYLDLMDGCENPKKKEIIVLHRVQGDTEWKKGRRTKLSGKRPKTLYLEHLNPCDRYEVTLAVDEEQLPIFNVGPFYNGDYEHVFLHQEQDNEVYESYSVNPLNYVKIVSEEDSAKIIVSNICARIIELEVQEEGEVVERPHQLIRLQNDLKSSMKLEEQLSYLKPCTKYQITLDLFLNDDNSEDSNEVDNMRQNWLDFRLQNFTAFHTMPAKESPDKATFDPETKTLTWDFNQFFDQDCASADPTDIKNINVTLVQGEHTFLVDLAGSMELISDCDTEFSLKVEYSKEKETWSRQVTAFNQVAPGVHGPTEESVLIQNNHLVLTLDPCLSEPDMVMFVPLNVVHQPIWLTSEQVKSLEVSDVAWVGCLDYQVQVQRGEESPKQLNQLNHPGWKTALDNVVLKKVSSTNQSAVLRKPEIFWEDPAITLEVRCNASVPEEESNVTEFAFGVVFEKVFEVDQPLEMAGLMSNTEYECEARLVKEDAGSSRWSDMWTVVTRDTGEDPETTTESLEEEATSALIDKDEATMESQAEMDNFSQILSRSGLGNADEPKTSANTAAEPESAVKHEHAAEPDPSTKSSGNLNSFVSLSLFLATFIIKSF